MSSAPLIQVPLDSIDWTLTEKPDRTGANPSVDPVGSVGVVEPKPPPSTLLARLDDAQRKRFLEMWDRFPSHLRDFHLREIAI